MLPCDISQRAASIDFWRASTSQVCSWALESTNSTGIDAEGLDQSETSVGFVLGVTGEFEINRRFGFLIEFMGHVTEIENSNLFATGHAGLAVHF